jgi:hypothetical protein
MLLLSIQSDGVLAAAFRLKPRVQTPARDAKRCDQCAGNSRNQVADERSGCEHGSGGKLPNGNRINELLFSKPMETVDELRPQEDKQQVSTPENYSSDFQEREK